MSVRLLLAGLGLLTASGCAYISETAQNDQLDLYDADGDGHYDAAKGGDDCDDGNDAVSPSNDELCDGIDNNCNATTDEGVTVDGYADADGDGFGTGARQDVCPGDDGMAGVDGDCDDADDTRYPLAAEICDGIDQDCDGDVDDGVLLALYADTDGDGFGKGSVVEACAAVDGLVDNDDDCNDGDVDVHPGAAEICDLVDSDCDGDTFDPESPGTVAAWLDGDGDDFGDPATAGQYCPELSIADNGEDCDDSAFAINPAATEVCDNIDNNCSGDIDVDASDATLWAPDNDGDSYGSADPDDQVRSCGAPTGLIADISDCDDADATANADGTEVCGDGIDNDCDGDPSDCGYGGDIDVDVSGAVNGPILEGRATHSLSGAQIAVGDLDGDGTMDLVVSSTGDNSGNGSVDIFYDAASLTSGTIAARSDVHLTGPPGQISTGFGQSLAIADVNGGGLDLIVGASGADDSAGAVYVYNGATLRAGDTSVADTRFFPDMPDAADRDSKTEQFPQMGVAIASLGDLNNDGLDDLLVGASRADGETNIDAGMAIVIFGADDIGATTGALAAGSNSLWNESTDSYLGSRVAAGDLDGDGLTDAVIGGFGYPSLASQGRLIAISHLDLLDLHTNLDNTDQTIREGENAGEQLGSCLAIGDFIGDGYGDIAAGSRFLDGEGGIQITEGHSNVLEEEDLPVTVTIEGTSSVIGLGEHCANLGDLDSDGDDELFATAIGNAPIEMRGSFIFAGGFQSIGSHPHTAFEFLNFKPSNSHKHVTGAISADLNGDGALDILYGRRRLGESPNQDTGQVGILFGEGI